MNTQTCASNLGEALKTLKNSWQQTRSEWRDTKAIEFERDYLESLPHSVAQARLVMQEIDALLKKVREDCCE